jgi:hypothetical protein
MNSQEARLKNIGASSVIEYQLENLPLMQEQQTVVAENPTVMEVPTEVHKHHPRWKQRTK